MADKPSNLQQVLTMEETMGLETLYSTEKSFLTAPQQAGSRGIRCNLTFDLKAGHIDLENFGCQDLISRKMDLADSKVNSPEFRVTSKIL